MRLCDMDETSFMTERERALKERQERVVNIFTKYRERFPELARTRIAGSIAELEGLTVPGVIYILQGAGVWKGGKD